jgi:hypothetical protein
MRQWKNEWNERPNSLFRLVDLRGRSICWWITSSSWSHMSQPNFKLCLVQDGSCTTSISVVCLSSSAACAYTEYSTYGDVGHSGEKHWQYKGRLISHKFSQLQKYSTVNTNYHVKKTSEHTLIVLLCQLPISTNKTYKVLLSSYIILLLTIAWYVFA